MKVTNSKILLASSASLLALAMCNPALAATPADQAPKDPVAATVNGTPISQRTVDLLAKQGASKGNPDTPESRRAIIDQLALQMVVAEEAIKKGLDKTPEVAEQVAAIKQAVLASAYVQDFVKNNPVTDDRVKAEYERVKATVTGSEYKARHILVETEADLSAIAPEFGAAASKLEKGQFTQAPVQTQFGYHVILVEDAKPIEAPPLEEVKPMLSQQLQQQDWEKQLEALKAKTKIEIVGASAPAP
jgi:peptidyl-prolyl cis-trans isomerase C